jgi:hypothetical protein
MFKHLVKQYKLKSKKQSLLLKMSTLTSNEIGNLIKQSSDGFLHTKEWKNLRQQAIEIYGKQCAICKVVPNKKNPCNIDHIKPRKFFPELALDILNLQLLCAKCNKRKGNKY